jgi:hypothetical protein
MQLNYFCYYPHMYGDLSGSAKIDATVFAMLLTLSNEAGPVYAKEKTPEQQIAQETLDELIDEVKETLSSGYALEDACGNVVIDPKKILRGLKNKGWYADQWEEGSFYVCDDEHIEAAQKRLNQIERDLMEVDFD